MYNKFILSSFFLFATFFYVCGDEYIMPLGAIFCRVTKFPLLLLDQTAAPKAFLRSLKDESKKFGERVLLLTKRSVHTSNVRSKQKNKNFI